MKVCTLNESPKCEIRNDFFDYLYVFTRKGQFFRQVGLQPAPQRMQYDKGSGASVSIYMMAKGRTASEVFLLFTTQLYSCQCNYNAPFSYIDKREVLQPEYSQPSILVHC